MSVLSDETDVLLLIPPDFFMVPSDSEEDTISLRKPIEKLLVSDLISQVNDLEGRICMIENQSSMSAHGNLQNLRHFGSADTLNVSCKSNHNSRSLQTTPLKSQTLPSPHKNWRTGCNISPSKVGKRLEQHQNMLMSHDYVNQKERDDQLLKEIHKFFKYKKNSNKIDDFDLHEAICVNENSVSGLSEIDSKHLSAAVFNLNKVNELLKQLEETQAEIEQKLKLKGIAGVDSEENIITDSQDKKIECDKKLNSDMISGNASGDKTPRRVLNFDLSSPQKKNDIYEGDTAAIKKSKTETAVANDSQVEENCGGSLKVENEITDGNPEFKKESQSSSSELSNLLSLCDLWGNSKKVDDHKLYDDQKVLKQKYQEEKFRRRHCEEIIQKLQLRLLEEQQKIAVAIKVDREKDEAISKLTEGWSKLISHWRELENQKTNMEKKLQLEREKFQSETNMACQTVKRFETELSKALDLAHGYKEKCESSEKEKRNLVINSKNEIEKLNEDLEEVKNKFQAEKSKVDKLERLVTAKEENLNQAKSKLSEMQNQIRELKKNLKDQQTEMEILKHEREKFSEKVKEEKNRNAILEQSKKTLIQNSEEFKKKEKALKDHMKIMSEQMEKIKVELKDFYQEQVEKIVQEKLREFQEQLATAEKKLQEEMEARERTVTEMAVKQVQQIVEKHVVEVNLLEEKHNEEIELWKIKVIQAEEKVEELQKKLEIYCSHKTEIAQKLQTVMETHWQEALKIITASSPLNVKSPLNSGRSDSDQELTRQNTFTMSSCGRGEGNLNKNGQTTERESPLSMESPFCKEGQITYREQSKLDPSESSNAKTSYRIDETPQKIKSETVYPLKKYIQMLLKRPPGIPPDDSLDMSFDSTLFNGVTNDSTSIQQWQHILTEGSGHRSNSESTIQKVCFKSSKEKENRIPWK